MTPSAISVSRWCPYQNFPCTTCYFYHILKPDYLMYWSEIIVPLFYSKSFNFFCFTDRTRWAKFSWRVLNNCKATEINALPVSVLHLPCYHFTVGYFLLTVFIIHLQYKTETYLFAFYFRMIIECDPILCFLFTFTIFSRVLELRFLLEREQSVWVSIYSKSVCCYFIKT